MVARSMASSEVMLRKRLVNPPVVMVQAESPTASSCSDVSQLPIMYLYSWRLAPARGSRSKRCHRRRPSAPRRRQPNRRCSHRDVHGTAHGLLAHVHVEVTATGPHAAQLSKKTGRARHRRPAGGEEAVHEGVLSVDGGEGADCRPRSRGFRCRSPPPLLNLYSWSPDSSSTVAEKMLSPSGRHLDAGATPTVHAVSGHVNRAGTCRSCRPGRYHAAGAALAFGPGGDPAVELGLTVVVVGHTVASADRSVEGGQIIVVSIWGVHARRTPPQARSC